LVEGCIVSAAKYRIDQALLNDEGQPLARFSVAGDTLEMAMMSSQLLTSPHIANGLSTYVSRVGIYDEDVGAYRDVGAALASANAPAAVDSEAN
jgi:hypothetical protein